MLCFRRKDKGKYSNKEISEKVSLAERKEYIVYGIFLVDYDEKYAINRYVIADANAWYNTFSSCCTR